MWMMEGKKPVEVYARSVDRALGPLCKGIDATAGTITLIWFSPAPTSPAYETRACWPQMVAVTAPVSGATFTSLPAGWRGLVSPKRCW